MSIVNLTEKAIAIKVPKGAKEFFIHDGWVWTNETYPNTFTKKLPPGSWSILGMSDKLTEDEWKKVVGIGYEDYRTIKWLDFKTMHLVYTATESGQSLLKQKGITTPHLILINNK